MTDIIVTDFGYISYQFWTNLVTAILKVRADRNVAIKASILLDAYETKRT